MNGIWIRSQDKTILGNFSDLCVTHYEGEKPAVRAPVTSRTWVLWVLGEYSTKERALEVLGQIQGYINSMAYCKTFGEYLQPVFEMPQE